MDPLEQRLRAADPAPASAPIDRPDSDRARNLVEGIMNDLPNDDYAVVSLDSPPRSNRFRWIAAAAAVAVVVGGAVAVSQNTDDADGGVPLALSLAAEDSMAMCMEVTPDSLAAASQVAFEGTVASIDGDVATLDVDRWFAGEETSEVTVTSPDPSMAALLGGVELETGARYLISAADGMVLSCGLSGPSEPNLTAIFEAAFP